MPFQISNVFRRTAAELILFMIYVATCRPWYICRGQYRVLQLFAAAYHCLFFCQQPCVHVFLAPRGEAMKGMRLAITGVYGSPVRHPEPTGRSPRRMDLRTCARVV